MLPHQRVLSFTLACIVVLSAAAPATAELLDGAPVATISEAGAEAGDGYGNSVSLADDLLIVGAEWDDERGSNAGAAYIYRSASADLATWLPEAQLVPFDGESTDFFGHAVAIAGNTAVVGAPQSPVRRPASAEVADEEAGDSSPSAPDGPRTGAVYVYQFDGESWTLARKIKSPSQVAGADFGWSVDLCGDVVVVGAYGIDRVFTFGRDEGGPGNWGLRDEVVGAAGSGFGWSVACDVSRMIVGAPFDSGPGGDTGSVSFYRLVSPPSLSTHIDGSPGTQQLGSAVDIHLNTAVAATGYFALTGTVHVYDASERRGEESAKDEWALSKIIRPGDGGERHGFGRAIGLTDDVLVAAATLDGEAASDAGALYLLARDAGGAGAWGQIAKLTLDDAEAQDYLGTAIDIDGTRVMTSVAGDNAPPAAGTVRGYVLRSSDDIDGDGILDTADNCITSVNIRQRDTNNDGLGNACDPDLDNDCTVSFTDLALLKAALPSEGDRREDFNGDDFVNSLDLVTMKSLFFRPPGPSGIDNDCQEDS